MAAAERDPRRLIERLRTSRWGWFAHGLPSIARAAALFRVRPYTMTTAERSKKLWDLCNQVIRRDVKGDFVECGVWKGGSAGLMALAQKHCKQRRAIHLFDSFEGLPEPTAKDGFLAAEYSGGRASGMLESVDKCTASMDEVRSFLTETLNIDSTLLRFHVGWFQETIPNEARTVGPISVLRLDGDWYESTRVCLKYLYPLLERGGIVILDDYYCWQGCAAAADEFRIQFAIKSPIHRVDEDAIYWEMDHDKIDM